MKKIVIIFIFIFLVLTFRIRISANITSSSYSTTVMNLDTNEVIYQKNSNERLLTASIAKVLTAIVAIENCNLQQHLKVDKQTVLQVGSKIYLEIEDEIKVLDLIYGLMMRSGNDAAYLLSKCIDEKPESFIKIMNDYCKKIGMKHSTFENTSGLDEESYNYSTSYDMALLVSYSMKNDIFKDINNTRNKIITTKNNKTYTFINKHKLFQSNKYITGGKTGYTKSAKRTLITTASVNGLNLVVVTFKGSDDWSDHKALINYAARLNKILLVKKGKYKYNFIGKEIAIRVNENIYSSLSKKSIKDMKAEFTFINDKLYLIVTNNKKIIIKKELDYDYK